MSPDLRPGIRFEWQYSVPERARVPNLYHDTAFCRAMPDVMAPACTRGIIAYVDWLRERQAILADKFNARLAGKVA